MSTLSVISSAGVPGSRPLLASAVLDLVDEARSRRTACDEMLTDRSQRAAEHLLPRGHLMARLDRGPDT